jgi:hypothetical protein
MAIGRWFTPPLSKESTIPEGVISTFEVQAERFVIMQHTSDGQMLSTRKVEYLQTSGMHPC